MIAGIWADKFDQLAAFQNFLIMPLTMLSGVSAFDPFPAGLLAGVSHFNPFFLMIDGFRYGFFGVSDVTPWTALASSPDLVSSCSPSITPAEMLAIGASLIAARHKDLIQYDDLSKTTTPK